MDTSIVITMSRDELKAMIADAVAEALQGRQSGTQDTEEMVYGLAGVMNLLHISKSTACKMNVEGRFDKAKVATYGNKLIFNKKALLTTI